MTQEKVQLNKEIMEGHEMLMVDARRKRRDSKA